jgi:hypothetical protein
MFHTSIRKTKKRAALCGWHFAKICRLRKEADKRDENRLLWVIDEGNRKILESKPDRLLRINGK